MRLSGLLNRLNLKGNDYDKYILIPEVENRETLEDQASKYFSLYSKTWQTITITFNHLRQTYITSEAILL